MLLLQVPVPQQDAPDHPVSAGEPKDLTVDELAALGDTIMLSQANVQSLMAEVTANQHNAEVLAVRQ